MTSSGSVRSGTCALELSLHGEVLMLRRVLVTFDRAISAALGRPCAIQDEECAPLYVWQIRR
jgi:hypothetical protein